MAKARTTRKGNVTTISYEGPFFRKDPVKTLAENMDAMLQATAREGMEDVRAQIGSFSMPYSREWSQTRPMPRKNQPWRRKTRWSLLWTSTQGLDARRAIRTMAAMSSIESRWHPWRKTKNRLLKARAINKAELVKGLQ